MKNKTLFIGELVAMGFSKTGNYLLTISHDGRGLFSTRNWEIVARDSNPAYPNAGFGIGIGPVEGESIPIREMDYGTEYLKVRTPDERWELSYFEGALEFVKSDFSRERDHSVSNSERGS